MITTTRRHFTVGALGVALSLAVAACKPAVRKPGPVGRVVTLTPNATEIVFALGRGPAVAGVSRYDDYPGEVSTITRVGGMVDPSFEAIATLRPDAIFGAKGPVNRAVLERFERMHVRVVFPSFNRLDDLSAGIKTFANELGVPSRGEELSSQIDRAMRAIDARVASAVTAGAARPRVLVVVGQRPLYIAGPDTFLGDLVTRAGGDNVAAPGTGWANVSLEAVIAMAPAVVLDLTAMEENAGSLADTWRDVKSIPAVRDGRVVQLRDPVVTRPGPRVPTALRAIAMALHPTLAIPESDATVAGTGDGSK